jgi:hypothetical protein
MAMAKLAVAADLLPTDVLARVAVSKVSKVSGWGDLGRGPAAVLLLLLH